MRVLFGYANSLVRDFIREHMSDREHDITVLAAGTLRETMQLAAETSELDVIGLDLEMPDMDGLAGLDAIRPQCGDHVPIALIGPLRASAEVQHMLARWASGYLPYSLGSAAILAAVRVLAAGETYIPVEMMAQSETMRDKVPNYLTRRERDVLNGLLAGQSNKEIARIHNLSEVTIKHHLKSLRSKLGARNRTHAVCRAIELGIADDDTAFA